MYLTCNFPQACVEFLKRHMSPLTCISLRSFAKTIQCEELEAAADRYTLQHFKEISQTADFCKLSYTQVINWLKTDITGRDVPDPGNKIISHEPW